MRINKTIIFLTGLVIYVTAFNLYKPIHIDDQAYIMWAEELLKTPLMPLSIVLNLGDKNVPAYTINQAPLFSYLLAASFFVFGESEFVAHLLIALFSMTCIVLFYLICKRVCPQKKYFLTLVFAGSAYFIPSQNVMCDIPLMAFILLFILFMITPRYLLAAGMIFFAILTKYIGLILIPVYVLQLLYRKHYKSLLYLCLPVVGLCLWCVWNLFDYGAVHMFGRDANFGSMHMYTDNFVKWLFTFGGLFTCTFLLLPVFKNYKYYLFVLYVTALAVAFIFSSERHFFILNGLIALVTAISFLFKKIRENDSFLLLLLIMLASVSFIVLFAPFVAVRHVFLAFPSIIIAFGLLPEDQVFKYISIVLTIILGFSIAATDYRFASIYRDQIPIIKDRYSNQKVYCACSWGCYWYCRKAGYEKYMRDETKLSKQDIIIKPRLAAQYIEPAHEKIIEKIDEIIVSGYFKTMNINAMGGYYSATSDNLPWMINNSPVEVFEIYRVVQ